MFSLTRWFRKWRRPVIILGQNISLDELSGRVQQRLRGVSDADDPLRSVFEIAAEESAELLAMEHLRKTMKVREWVHTLPPQQRAVLIDHIDRGLTYKEIARERGMAEKIVLRDLSRAYVNLRMRSINESSDNGERGRVQTSVDTQPAGVRDSAPHVGVDSGVHCSGAPCGRVPGSAAVQRPDEGGEEGRPHEPPPTS